MQIKSHPPDVSLSGVTSAAGIGLATLVADGTVLDTWFPAPELGAEGASGTTRLSVAEIPEELGVLTGPDEDRGVEIVAVRTTISSLDDKATDAYDAYLRLHLLSHRLVAPHGLEPRRLLRPADQRRVDQPRAVRGRRLRDRAAPAARGAGR